MRVAEVPRALVLAVLSAGFVIIGVAPAFLLTLVEASAKLLMGGR